MNKFMTPAQCFAESQEYLSRADDSLANDEEATAHALIQMASVYAELAKVKLSTADGASIGLDIDEEEDLRP